MTHRPDRNLPRSERVYRPPGLSIAIIATAVIYGLLPLANIYFKWRVQTVDDSNLIGSGIDITTWDWLGGAFGVGLLLLCIPAWRGRPGRIRFVFMGALLLVVGVHLFRIIEVWTDDVNPIFDGQAGQTIHDFLMCQVPMLIIVPLYVIWYFNRAPARAYYQGVPLARLAERAGLHDSTARSTPPDTPE